VILAAQAKQNQPTKLQSNQFSHCSDLSRGRKFIEHLVREAPAGSKTEQRVGEEATRGGRRREGEATAAWRQRRRLGDLHGEKEGGAGSEVDRMGRGSSNRTASRQTLISFVHHRFC
jgi:hypothetical protein